MLSIYDGSLDVAKIFDEWYELKRGNNYGAYASFVGTIRDEDGIEGLSFDIYEPLLVSWLDAWQAKAKAKNAEVMMAHSRGDVPNHTSSYIAAVFSPKRRVALEMLDEFVEDFKANAPIWKYDLRDGERIYAKDRSTPLKGSGVLA
ncbi:MAG: molybdenum cofactor biosynthesis protein MoaE [Sulfuricurvum sp.]|jgi:molybdopterin synthase catalytic subunit